MAKKKNIIDTPISLEKQLEALDTQIRKKFGDRSLILGDSLSRDTSTLSTGSLRTDMILKYPIPIGVHEIAGGMGAGKSTISMHICINAQKKGWPTYYIDLERALNPSFIGRFKELDLKTFRHLKPQTGEAATEMALDIFRSVEHAVVIYDSVSASLATEAVMAKTMSEQTMGTVAKLMSTFLAKATPLADDSGGRLILINQLRDNLSMYGGRPTPGGNAVEHYTQSRIFLKGHNTKANRIYDDRKVATGKKVNVEVVKNRWSPPGTETEMVIKFDSGIWKDMELFMVAVSMGVVNRSGAWYNYGDIKLGQGDANAIKFLEENLEVATEIKSTLYSMLSLTEEIQEA